MSTAQSLNPKLAAQVARRIEADIADAGWPVGRLLGSATELRERYGVSPAVLREAVRIVEHHKVARMRPGPSGGLVVQAPDATPSARALVIYLAHVGTTIPDLVYARALLEPLAAGLAARRLTDGTIARLRGMLDTEAGQRELNIQDDLHLVLAELSGNPALALFIEVLILLTRHYVSDLSPSEGHIWKAKTASMAAHSAIVEAVLCGEAALAETRTGRHIRALAGWFDVKPPTTPFHLAGEDNGETRLKLAEIVATRIHRDIMAADLEEGDVVGSAPELIARYEISSACLREAVRLLEFHSVAAMRRGPGGGLIVARPDPSASIEAIALYLDYRRIDYDSLRVVRDVVELGAIELVVARRAEPGVADRLTAALRVNPATPREELAALGHLFHTELAELTGNPVLALFQRILTVLSARHMGTDVGSGAGPARTREVMATESERTHRAIAEAILSGDTALAKHWMRRHLEALTKEYWD